jgi:hypothetical protein
MFCAWRSRIDAVVLSPTASHILIPDVDVLVFVSVRVRVDSLIVVTAFVTCFPVSVHGCPRGDCTGLAGCVGAANCGPSCGLVFLAESLGAHFVSFVGRSRECTTITSRNDGKNCVDL